MLDFIFFDAGIRDRFVAYLKSLQLASTVRDDHFGWVVAVPEKQLTDALMHELEATYDSLQDEQMRLTEEEAGGLEKHVAGFRVTLPDGRTTTVAVSPDIANRLMAHFSLEEIDALFASVARSALHPNDDPICKM